MNADLKNLRKHVKFMKKEGVLKLKTSEMELELSPAAILPEPPSLEPSEESTESPQPSEEEILFWSAPGIPPFSPEDAN